MTERSWHWHWISFPRSQTTWDSTYVRNDFYQGPVQFPVAQSASVKGCLQQSTRKMDVHSRDWSELSGPTRRIFQPIGSLALADPQLLDLKFLMSTWMVWGWLYDACCHKAEAVVPLLEIGWQSVSVSLKCTLQVSKTKCLQPKVDIWMGHSFIHFSSMFLGRLISDWTEECNTAIGVVVQPVRSLRQTPRLCLLWKLSQAKHSPDKFIVRLCPVYESIYVEIQTLR